MQAEIKQCEKCHDVCVGICDPHCLDRGGRPNQKQITSGRYWTALSFCATCASSCSAIHRRIGGCVRDLRTRCAMPAPVGCERFADDDVVNECTEGVSPAARRIIAERWRGRTTGSMLEKCYGGDTQPTMALVGLVLPQSSTSFLDL
jgi:hypothetical protein